MGHDFNRPFMKQESMDLFEAIDQETASRFGKKVRAAILPNVEYRIRWGRLEEENNMKPPPSAYRIFPGYIVVRKLNRKGQYETWMPDHVFEELYKKI